MTANVFSMTDVPTALGTLQQAGVVDVTYTMGFPSVKMENLKALRQIVEQLTGEPQVLKLTRGDGVIKYSYVVDGIEYYFTFQGRTVPYVVEQ